MQVDIVHVNRLISSRSIIRYYCTYILHSQEGDVKEALLLLPILYLYYISRLLMVQVQCSCTLGLC